ncbi:MAG: MFS transporter [Planctomycetota bacterium]
MPAGPQSLRPTPLWRNVSFTLTWTSTAATGFGDRAMMLVGLALLGGIAASGSADATATQASTQFFFFLPYLIFSVPGGWLADKLPRKWIMLCCDESRGLILLLSWWALLGATGDAALPDSYHWRIYATLFAVGTAAAIFNPARTAIVPQLIPPYQLQAGNAVILVINVVASMIAMVIIGRTMDVTDVGTVRGTLLAGASFYLVSGCFFAFLKTRDFTAGARSQSGEAAPIDTSVGKTSMLDAAWYIVSHRRIALLIVINSLIWSSAALVITSTFGVAKMFYGLHGNDLLRFNTNLGATVGGGMIAGGALIALINTRRESPIVYLAALVAAGLAVLVYALVPWPPATYATVFLVGLFGNVAIVGVISLIQSTTPNWVRGRVLGLSAMLSTTASVAVYFAVWRLPNADQNIIPVLWAVGPLLAIVGLAGLWRYMRSGPLDSPFVNAMWRFARLYCLAWCRVAFTGKHRVPHTGPVILASNHTTGLDPFVMQAGVYRPIRWLMIKSYELPWLWFLWREIKPISMVPGESTLRQIRQIVTRLKEGEVVGVFPEGSLQRSIRRVKPLQPGIAGIAKLSKAPILPMWIDGTPRRHPMFWHFATPCHVHITFGEPYTPDRKAEDADVIADLRQKLLALGRRRAFDVHAARHPDRREQIEAWFHGGENTDATTGQLIFDDTPGEFEEGTFGTARG